MQRLEGNYYVRHGVVIFATLLTFGLSLRQASIAGLDVDELFEIQQFVAPPLSGLFINYWANGQLPHVLLTRLFAAIYWDVLFLRSGSVMAGVVCVPLIYQLAGHFFNKQTATLSAFLLSITITHIRFSGYARGYSLLLLLSLVVIYCFSRAMKSGQRRWWVILAIVAAINIHNHIFAVFLMAALFIFAAGWAWQKRAQLLSCHQFQLKNMGVAATIMLLLLLPIPVLLYTGQNSLSALLADNNWPTSFPSLTLSQPGAILSPFIQISYDFSPSHRPGWPSYGFAAFFVIGTVVGFRQTNYRWGTTLLVLVLVAPLLLMTLATTALGPWFYALRRYFLFVMPSYLILASLGLLSGTNFLTRIFFSRKSNIVFKTAHLTILLTLLSPAVFSIWQYSVNITENYQVNPFNAGRFLQAQVQENDIILCVPDQDWRISGGREPCSLNLNLYPNLAPNVYYLDHLANYNTLREFLNPESNCINRYIHLPHPNFQIGCAATPNVQTSGNIWLVLWRNRDITTQAALTDSLPALLKQRFGATDIIYLPNEGSLAHTLRQAGEIALAESKTPLRQFENLISLASIYLATEDTARAFNTLDKAIFTSRWPEAVSQLAKLQAQLSYLSIPTKPDVELNTVWNEQVILQGIGQTLKNNTPSPGTVIQITFYWQALRPVTTPYQVLLHLVDDQKKSAAIFDFQPFDGYRPMTDWSPGQPIRETRTFELPPTLPPGHYTLVVGLYHPQTLERLPLTGQTQGVWPLAEWDIR